MGNRDHVFASDEFYHCYNRGVDKRTIFLDIQDYRYFIKSIVAYNSNLKLGKLRLHDNTENLTNIVEVLAYSLLPNHYHFLIQEKTENGISTFFKRVAVGYTLYFNQKYKRSGSLFQGVFKSKYIETDQDLRQVLGYVYFNNKVHNISDETQYRKYINSDNDIVRGFTSNNVDLSSLLEIAEIIREKRLDFKEY